MCLGVIGGLSPSFRSEKSIQDGRVGIVTPIVCLGLAETCYKVVSGAVPVECTGRKKNPPVINTPSGSVEMCDSQVAILLQ